MIIISNGRNHHWPSPQSISSILNEIIAPRSKVAGANGQGDFRGSNDYIVVMRKNVVRKKEHRWEIIRLKASPAWMVDGLSPSMVMIGGVAAGVVEATTSRALEGKRWPRGFVERRNGIGYWVLSRSRR